MDYDHYLPIITRSGTSEDFARDFKTILFIFHLQLKACNMFKFGAVLFVQAHSKYNHLAPSLSPSFPCMQYYEGEESVQDGCILNAPAQITLHRISTCYTL